MTCCDPVTNKDRYTFQPDYRIKPLTEKFWSRNYKKEKQTTSKVLYYEENIEKIRKYDARCHSKMPRYTNQTYGWLPGYKIRFLQYCDLDIYDGPALQKVAKELQQQHFKGAKTLIDHCACKKLLKEIKKNLVNKI